MKQDHIEWTFLLRLLLLLTALFAKALTAAPTDSPISSRLIDGVYFGPSARPSLVKQNGFTNLPVGTRVRRLYLLGMTNSLDQGSPGWKEPVGKRDRRFFLGSTIGSVTLVNSSATSVTLPLTFGYNVWWWEAFSRDGYRAPFDTPQGDQLLTSTLRLRETGRKPPEAFVMALEANGAEVREVVIRDNPELSGFPVIAAVTAKPCDSTATLALTPRGPVTLPPFEAAPIDSKAINLTSAVDDCASAVEALRAVLYSSDEQLARIEHFSQEPPPNYNGPRVVFRGTKPAEMLTNQFSHNLMDMLTKTEGGRYRTSTPGAPNWGRYRGFGTWKDNVGWNEERAWSRDFAPTLVELAELGYQSRAEALCEYAWKWARWFRDVDMRYPDGTPVPPHWIRAIDRPTETRYSPVREGVQENDGHGLLMLATYKTWQRTQNPKAWARAHWSGFTDAAEWICWQFEHPELSGATQVMRTESECSRKPEKSPYAEFPCAMGLLSHAEIADAIGETTSAFRWRERANKMLAAMPKAYLREDPYYGTRWDNAFSWGGHYPALGPLIDLIEYNGFRPAQSMPQWLDINRNTYLWQLHEHKGQPPDYHAAAFGYGQAFTAEAALLLDRMDEATSLVETMARLAWFPGFKPWIVPEGVEWTEDRKFWFRTCDLGNGVQQAHFIKTVRLLIGIDDSNPDKLEILPRLPNGWTAMEASGLPALTRAGSAKLNLQYERPSPEQHIFVMSSDRDVAPMTIRLGPFAPTTQLNQLQVRMEETTGTVALGQEGLHAWVYLHTSKPGRAAKIQLRRKPPAGVSATRLR